MVLHRVSTQNLGLKIDYIHSMFYSYCWVLLLLIIVSNLRRRWAVRQRAIFEFHISSDSRGICFCIHVRFIIILFFYWNDCFCKGPRATLFQLLYLGPCLILLYSFTDMSLSIATVMSSWWLFFFVFAFTLFKPKIWSISLYFLIISDSKVTENSSFFAFCLLLLFGIYTILQISVFYSICIFSDKYNFLFCYAFLYNLSVCGFGQ